MDAGSYEGDGGAERGLMTLLHYLWTSNMIAALKNRCAMRSLE